MITVKITLLFSKSKKMEEECAFRWKFKFESGLEGLTQAGPARIKTIIICSQASGDGMHVLELQNRLDVDSLLTIWCHTADVAMCHHNGYTYT